MRTFTQILFLLIISMSLFGQNQPRKGDVFIDGVKVQVNYTILKDSDIFFVSDTSYFHNQKLKSSSIKIKDEYFELTYIYCGLGSNIGKMSPKYKIINDKFIYTSEQNSYYSGKLIQPDTILIGEFRQSSIDSINTIISEINETLIYRTNPNVMSGGICTIFIKSNDKKVEFRLHNATDNNAKLIVEILNTYIADKEKKLYLE